MFHILPSLDSLTTNASPVLELDKLIFYTNQLTEAAVRFAL